MKSQRAYVMHVLERIGRITADSADTLLGDCDNGLPWSAVQKLQLLGTQEVFDGAAEFCRSDDALKRSRGAEILGQIGTSFAGPVNRFPDASFSILSNMLREEQETRPLASAIYALGHLRNPAAIGPLTDFAHHASADVRHATAFALGCFADDSKAAEALMELMNDAEEDVRDWATFGLGGLGSLDSDRIRSALYSRLQDTSEHVRGEALAGLAKRQDRRIVPLLRSILQDYEFHDYAFEAADSLLGVNGLQEKWTAQDYLALL